MSRIVSLIGFVACELAGVGWGIQGASHSRDICGFSITLGTPIPRHRRRTVLEKRPRMLPVWTLAASAAARPGSPSTWVRDLSGGGPPGISRARDQELHATLAARVAAAAPS